MDLADGHIAALRKLFTTPDIGDALQSIPSTWQINVRDSCFSQVLWTPLLGCTAYNLGTGHGTSVLEMVAAFEKASGKVTMGLFPSSLLPQFKECKCANPIHWTFFLCIQKIPVKLCPRRPGDATQVYASTEKAEKELGWKYGSSSHFPFRWVHCRDLHQTCHLSTLSWWSSRSFCC